EAAIAKDLAAAPELDRASFRYLTLAHLANAGRTDDELQGWRNGLSKLVNSLSWKKKIAVPTAVDATKTTLRLDLRDYDWTASTWEKIVARYPYAIGKGTIAVRGDWFLAAASAPPLYHEILQLPESDLELEKLVGVDVEKDIAQGAAKRAGFHASGVDAHSRLVERHASRYGAYWKSYEFRDDDGTRNFWVRPIAPIRVSEGASRQASELDFQHDANEIVFNLPNGLQAYMVVDANGARRDRVPVEIGWNREAKAGSVAIRNGVSCMGCHVQGIRADHEDVIRGYHNLANSVDRKLYEDAAVEAVKKLYPPRPDMKKLVEQDRAVYRKAVEATGATIGKKTDVVTALAEHHAQDVDTRLAAAELGLKEDALLEKLARSPVAGLEPLAKRGGLVTRKAFVRAFPEAARTLGVGAFTPCACGEDDEATTAGLQHFEAPFGDRVLSIEVDRTWRLASREDGLTLTREGSAKIRLSSARTQLAKLEDLLAQEKELLGARLREIEKLPPSIVEDFQAQTGNSECLDLVQLGKGRMFRMSCQADAAAFASLRAGFASALGTVRVVGAGEVDPLPYNALPEKLADAGFQNSLEAALAKAKKEGKLVFVYAKPDPNWFV
ncbi:hypothetical protein HY251_17905, partial [bacterium]|nr:hypothetical protein [bacterium]